MKMVIYIALLMSSITIYATENKAMTNELYELRMYELKFGSPAAPFMDYLKNSLRKATLEAGANGYFLFNELGKSDPTKIWVLISYPSSEAYVAGQHAYQSIDGSTQAAATRDAVHYNRYESWVFHAFDGMQQMMQPMQGKNLFELRIYEGKNEEAVRRKIKMFDVEEIDLFNRVGLFPVFFGEMIAGPHRPALVYMLQFKDMAERDDNWKIFIDHPEWKAMVAKEEYASTVSNIVRIFLVPL